MKQANLPITETINRLYLVIGPPAANRAVELCTRPIHNQVFALTYWIDQNMHIE